MHFLVYNVSGTSPFFLFLWPWTQNGPNSCEKTFLVPSLLHKGPLPVPMACTLLYCLLYHNELSPTLHYSVSYILLYCLLYHNELSPTLHYSVSYILLCCHLYHNVLSVTLHYSVSYGYCTVTSTTMYCVLYYIIVSPIFTVLWRLPQYTVPYTTL